MHAVAASRSATSPTGSLAHAGGRSRVVVDPALVRPVDVPRLVGDPTKLVAATGWSPRYTLADTLDAVLADARSRAQGS